MLMNHRANMKVFLFVVLMVTGGSMSSGKGLKCANGWLRYAGSCYLFKNNAGPITWKDAKNQCVSQDAWLVDIRDKNEWRFVKSQRDPYVQQYYVGVHEDQSGVWRFLDGSVMNITGIWAKGEPNDWKGKEDCVAMDFRRNAVGKYNDIPCGLGYGLAGSPDSYICKKKPTKKLATACEKITIPMCQGMGYNYTLFPNMFNHQTQDEAGLEVHQFYPLIKVGCSSSLRMFLCSMYAPMCTDKVVKPPPCRSLCEESKRGCSKFMTQFGFTWPSRFNCSNFPRVSTSKNMCIGDSNIGKGLKCANGWLRYAGSCYLFKNNAGPITWKDAKNQCVSQDAWLVDIRDKNEWRFVKSQRDPYVQQYYVGVHEDQSGVWRFLDGSVMNITGIWAKGEPNDWKGKEDCVAMDFRRNAVGKYNDIPCGLGYGLAGSPDSYICKKKPTKKLATACEKITIPMCQGIGYNYTLFPNMFNHQTQDEAGMEILQFHPLVKVGCSSSLKMFLCSMYAPMCTDKVVKPPPCRSLCEESKRGCSKLMTMLGFTWPSRFNCSNFPRVSTSKNMCIGDSNIGKGLKCANGWLRYAGSCYLFKNNAGPITWKDAKNQCVSQDAWLVDIRDKNEWRFVKSQRDPYVQQYYVGVHEDQSGVWRFLDGSVMNITGIWAKGEPNDWKGKEDCVAMDFRRNAVGKYNDIPCGLGYGLAGSPDSYICKKKPTKKLATACEKITIPMCQGMGYNYTLFPNMFNHQTQDEAGLEVHQFYPLIKAGCSSSLKMFLCSMYAPMCTDKVVKPPPCRSLCEESKRGCSKLMTQFGFTWPSRFNCSNFPRVSTSKNMCIGDSNIGKGLKCANGWLRYAGSCYLFKNNAGPITWKDAKNQCVSQDAWLVDIRDKNEWRFVKSQRDPYVQQYYVGVHEDQSGVWRFLDGSVMNITGIWAKGEPNDWKGKEDCVAMDFRRNAVGKYNDIPCGLGYGLAGSPDSYICKKKPTKKLATACEKITIPMCQGMGYNYTLFPNMFNHQTQDEAGLEVHQFYPLIKAGCSSSLKMFLCSMYAPMCTDKVVKPPPCRSLCEESKRGCSKLMTQFGFTWPSRFNCSNFPRVSTSKNMCIGDSNIGKELKCANGWLRYAGSCYLFKNNAGPITWKDAKNQCVSQDAWLVDIRDKNEWRFVKSQRDPYVQQYYVGVHEDQSGVWRFLDGSVMNITGIWAKGEPNDWKGKEDCVAMDFRRNAVGKYNDIPCGLGYGLAGSPDSYICKKKPTKKLATACEKITIPMCQGIGYNYTLFPNMFNHQTQDEAGMEILQFHPLVKVGCSSSLKMFLCSMYAPMCTDKVVKPPPCRSLCEESKRGCSKLMTQFGFTWPSRFNCSNFPRVSTSKNMCIGDSNIGKGLKCANGWLRYAGSCYLFKNNAGPITWKDAKNQCVSQDAWLVDIRDKNEWRFVKSQRDPYVQQYYVGVHEDQSGVWRFLDGSVMNITGIWAKGEPNDWKGKEDCVAMDFRRNAVGKYNDIPCGLGYGLAGSPDSYICKKKPTKKLATACEKITIPMCQGMGYNYTLFPNMFNHQTQDEAGLEVHQFYPLIKAGCSSSLKMFLCSMYAPMCTDKVVKPPPCRSLCEESKRGCSKLMTQFGFTWPSRFNCSNFPRVSTSKNMCIGDSNIGKALKCANGWLRYAGSCYLFKNNAGPITWKDAKNQCVSQDAWLVDIRDKNEWRFVKSQRDPYVQQYYVGVHEDQSGVWRFLDGSVMNITGIWAKGEPNDWKGKEDCVAMDFRRNAVGKYNDIPCGLGYGLAGSPDSYICKKKPTKKLATACEKITIPMCQGMGYNYTLFPNMFNHQTQDEAGLEVHQFYPLIKAGCSSSLKMFLCSMYAPMCTDKVVKPPPCRSLCEESKRGCSKLMTQFGFTWPSRFNCSNFPRVSTSKNMCIGDSNIGKELKCANGWLRYAGSCYLFKNNAGPITWKDAKNQCVSQDAWLVDIRDKNEWRFVKSQRDPYVQQYYVGVHEDQSGVWRFLDGSVMNITGIWAKGEPNDWKGKEDCVAMDFRRNAVGKYNDIPCGLGYGLAGSPDSYICKKKPTKKLATACEKITIPMCQGIGYNYTLFPNMFNHQTQDEAGMEILQFHPLVKVGCSSSLKMFLCSMYAPMCTDKVVKPPPCRSLCEESKRGCSKLMTMLGFTWPSRFNCSNFPRVSTSKNMCIGDSNIGKGLKCANGWLRYAGSCYLFKNNAGPITWKDAKNQCVSQDAWLVDIRDKNEWRFVKSQRDPYVQQYYVGVHEDQSGVWRFLDGSVMNITGIWAKGEPNDWKGKEDCVAMDFRRNAVGKYNDIPCGLGYGLAGSPDSYICKKKPTKKLATACEKITIPMCQGMGYNYTLFPNMFNHQTQDEAGLEVHQFYPLIKAGCSSSLKMFLCSMYAPMCTDKVVKPPPCRSLCEESKRGCSKLMTQFGFTWPSRFNCSNFPRVSTSKNMCIGDSNIGKGLKCANGWLRYAGSCYLFKNNAGPITWKDAKNQCVSQDAWLVDIRDKNEWRFVKSQRDPYVQQYYVGVHEDQSGVWRFLDGSVMNITGIWAKGEPNDWKGKEDCVAMDFRRNAVGKYNDIPCGLGYGLAGSPDSYICKKKPTKKLATACEKITIPMCQGIGYNYTLFPNMFNHQTQDEAGLEVHQFYPLIKAGCSSSLKMFLCSMYAPMCTDKVVKPPPCRSLCEESKRGCSKLMTQFGFTWPSRFNCSNFPRVSTSKNMCIGDSNIGKELKCANGWLRYAGSCYLFKNNAGPITWKDAKNQCVSQDAWLVDIRDKNEWRFVKSQRDPFVQQYHVGVHEDQSGVWRFLDGSVMNITGIWAKGEPNDWKGKEDCVAMDFRRNAAGKYNDIPCGLGYGFAGSPDSYICKKKPTKKIATVCEKITIPMCQGMGYNYTLFPNMFNHQTQDEAGMEILQFHPLVKVGCSSSLKMFLCSMYAPMCTDKVVKPPPCRSLCEESKRGCSKFMTMLGFTWPSRFNCSNFPRVSTSKNMCIGDSKIATTTTTRRPTKKTTTPASRIRCGGILTSVRGIIKSPNYPRPYPQDIHCLWTIQLPYAYNVVKISIEKMSLEEDRNCFYDYIIVKDKMLNQVGRRHCGSYRRPYEVLVRGNKAFIAFVSDSSTSKKGFAIKYKGRIRSV